MRITQIIYRVTDSLDCRLVHPYRCLTLLFSLAYMAIATFQIGVWVAFGPEPLGWPPGTMNAGPIFVWLAGFGGIIWLHVSSSDYRLRERRMCEARRKRKSQLKLKL